MQETVPVHPVDSSTTAHRPDRNGLDVAHDPGGAPMSEPEGRTNHQHGSSLGTQCRELIGADPIGTDSTWPTTRMQHQ